MAGSRLPLAMGFRQKRRRTGQHLAAAATAAAGEVDIQQHDVGTLGCDDCDCLFHGAKGAAEHGLGAMKTEEAARYKSPVELAALRAIRAALDPKRIMNPRVLF